MNTSIKMMLSVLAVLSILFFGCTAPEPTVSAPAGEIAEDAEIAGELNELNELDELGSELDDLDWQEAEEAVKG